MTNFASAENFLRTRLRNTPLKTPLKVLVHSAKILATNSQRKYIFRWWKSHAKFTYLVDTPSPWLTFGTIDFLETYLRGKSGLRVFEYGSGGSTLYWLKHGCNVISIEHDTAWFPVVKERLGTNPNIDYRLVLPQEQAQMSQNDPADPKACLSLREEFRGYSFQNYVQQIDAYPDEYFDIILVDGRARTSCLYHSLPKVRNGGIIVLDNADRPHYLAQTAAFMGDFQKKEVQGYSPCNFDWERTDIYRKDR